MWEPRLDPPALLRDVCVVLVSPKRPVSVGTVARACSCFEVEDLRVVQPRCDHLTRSSRNASKGAQYLLHRAAAHDSLAGALKDCTYSAAFARWTGSQVGLGQLMATAQALAGSGDDRGGSSGSGGGAGRLALVFGREEAGMTDDELAACDAVVSINIGRLQESLSLSHAVSIVLSQLYSQRLEQQQQGAAGGSGGSYAVTSRAELAASWSDQGVER